MTNVVQIMLTRRLLPCQLGPVRYGLTSLMTRPPCSTSSAQPMTRYGVSCSSPRRTGWPRMKTSPSTVGRELISCPVILHKVQSKILLVTFTRLAREGREDQQPSSTARRAPIRSTGGAASHGTLQGTRKEGKEEEGLIGGQGRPPPKRSLR